MKVLENGIHKPGLEEIEEAPSNLSKISKGSKGSKNNINSKGVHFAEQTDEDRSIIEQEM